MFTATETRTAYDTDSYESSIPLYREVETTAQITDMFGRITYQKVHIHHLAATHQSLFQFLSLEIFSGQLESRSARNGHEKHQKNLLFSILTTIYY